MSIVMPICGMRRCLPRYVSDVLTRAFASFRLLLMSSKDPSYYKRVYRRCTKGSVEVQIFRRTGTKLDYTQGANLVGTHKECMAFVSSSSCMGPYCLRELCNTLPTSGAGRKMVINSLSTCLPGKSFRAFRIPRRSVTSRRVCLVLASLVSGHITCTNDGLCSRQVVGRCQINFIPFISKLRSVLFVLSCLVCTSFVIVHSCGGCICEMKCSMSILSIHVGDFPTRCTTFSGFLREICICRGGFGLRSDSLSEA